MHALKENNKNTSPTVIYDKKAPMTKNLLRLSLVLILVSMACSVPMMTDGKSPIPQIVSNSMATADPHATATPTPFQPIGPTGTALFPPTEIPADTPEADLGMNIPGLPTPIRIKKAIPKEVVNMLVLGSDFRPDSGFRTDVMMLVSINTKKGTVSVVSFPRDLYVTIPGWMTQRLNTAFPHGGFKMMQDTFEYNFGVRPSFYIMTNFQGFRSIIDSLGGINVDVGAYLSDTCDLPQAVYHYCTVYPGIVTMNGGTALWYVRSRHTSNDFDRTRRQREVLYAVFQKLMSLDAVNKLPELYDAYQSSVETNMNLNDLSVLVKTAPGVFADSSKVKQYAIGSDVVTNFTTDTGAMVLLPNYEAISQIINQAIFGE